MNQSQPIEEEKGEDEYEMELLEASSVAYKILSMTPHLQDLKS